MIRTGDIEGRLFLSIFKYSTQIVTEKCSLALAVMVASLIETLVQIFPSSSIVP
jgi:hypothetical protein